MFRDQERYEVGDVGFIKFSYIGSAYKVVIISIKQHRNLFGKKRYSYIVENADNLDCGDYLVVLHEDFITVN